MWLFAGGPPDKFGFIYQDHPSRSHDVAFNFWQSFKGFLHTDGYAGYSALFNKTDIEGVHCWAHARRNFVNITKTTKKAGLAHWAVAHIRKLYKIETQMKESGFTIEQIKNHRESQAKPLLAEFKVWLDKNALRVPPKSPIGKAIHYCLKYWNNLIRYCDDGRLEIDNNRSERAIKPFVIGRKNWIFCDSIAGAKAAATFYSLIETCKTHSIDPQKYLQYVFTEIPNYCEQANCEDLLPFNIDESLLDLPTKW